MKKSLIMLLLITSAAISFGQFTLGVKATGNLSYAAYKEAGVTSINKQAQVHAGAGILASYKFSELFSITGSLNYLEHGLKLSTVKPSIDFEIIDFKSDATTRLQYLQVPVYATFSVRAKTARLFAGAGPFASYGVGGSTRTKVLTRYANGSTGTGEQKQKAFTKNNNADAGFRRFDAGIGAEAGVQFKKGLFISVGYQYSLGDISTASQTEYKNRGIQLSIGYMLPRL